MKTLLRRSLFLLRIHRVNAMTTELLSPAGTLKHLQYAIAYGADAVYAGQPRYSLRVRNNSFNKIEHIKTGIATAHAQGKLFFLASNIAAHNDKVKTYIRDLEPIIACRPDALIMSDPGLIMLVRERWPEQVIHLSVQSNVVNYQAVTFWQNIGVQRIILSRELSLDEIREIRQLCPDIELEVFVHGALCMAYSGRCLLSGYFNHRDANQGACTNACRWKYDTFATNKTASGDYVKQHDPVAIEEKTRPGEYMIADEDEHGTYIMNSKDLRAIEHVHQLCRIGINSLKIEGRTKSYYYVARTAQLYRRAIHAAEQGIPFDPQWLFELDKLANRGYTEGFYRRHTPADELQNYEQGSSQNFNQQFVGEITDVMEKELTIEVKNKFVVGDTLEVISPTGNHQFVLDSMRDKNGIATTAALGSGHLVTIPNPTGIADIQYGLLACNRNKMEQAA